MGEKNKINKDEVKKSIDINEKGLKTKTYGVIMVQRSFVHSFPIFSFQMRSKCRETHYDKTVN